MHALKTASYIGTINSICTFIAVNRSFSISVGIQVKYMNHLIIILTFGTLMENWYKSWRFLARIFERNWSLSSSPSSTYFATSPSLPRDSFVTFKTQCMASAGTFFRSNTARNRLSLTITTWERACGRKRTKLYKSQSCFWAKSRRRIVVYGERARSFCARKTAARVSKTLYCACKLKF